MLHQRLAWRTGLATGTWAIIVGSGGAAVVDTAAAAARPRPGLGTLCNVVLIGAVVDLVLATVAPPHSLPARAAVMVAAVGLNGVATGLYIGAGLGPGPRDGLMTGARGPRSFAARGAHRDRGDRAAGRLAAWRHGR